MSTLRRFFSSWQGLAAGLVALGIYLLLPSAIRSIDPSAGVFDAGILHVIGLAALLYYLGIFATWTGWQLAFRSLDRAADRDLDAWFAYIRPPWRYVAVQGSFAGMALYWLACLWLAIRIAS